jgi:hypothetical protein
MGESGENTDEWINSFRKMLDANNIGWCFWPYKKMEDTRGIVTFPKPAFYDEIISYENEPNLGFEKMFLKLPPKENVRKAMIDYAKSSNFKTCSPNKGYIRSLGINKVN